MTQAHSDNIIVKPIKLPVTKSGLIYSDDSSDPLQQGIVISVGEKIKEINPGDKIVFNRAATYPSVGKMQIDNQEIVFVRFVDVRAVIN